MKTDDIRTEDVIRPLTASEQLDQVRGGSCLDEILYKGDVVAAALCMAAG